ncbi:DUF6998 domain-containing protein [Rhodoplanes sp. SY1]|uniref:DUF6998 domain-containing protein n=1 Tax=Rhodoplanes sp. SY1 TaxID=3166646 RepID=UPI0038B59478
MSGTQRTSVDWTEVRGLLDRMDTSIDRLAALFPGRKFTLDGHLVGSIGEVVAAHMFDLDLSRSSTKAHDAVASDGRRVQIKLTRRNVVAIRHAPDHLIVLRRTRQAPLEVVYNGPGMCAWADAGRLGSNGQRPISVKRLRELDRTVSESDRLPPVRPAPL